MSSMRSNYDVFVPLWLPALVSSRWIAQSETWAVESTGGTIQNDVHIDTYFCKPELIALRYINITISRALSVPNWSEMCGLVGVLTVLLLSPTWHPVNFAKQREGSRKYDAKNLIYVYDYLYAKHQRMGASNLKLVLTSSTWKCNTFHNFLSMFKIFFSKVSRSLIGWRSG